MKKLLKFIADNALTLSFRFDEVSGHFVLMLREWEDNNSFSIDLRDHETEMLNNDVDIFVDCIIKLACHRFGIERKKNE